MLMLLKKFFKKVLKSAKISNVFQNTQNHGFEIFTFAFYLEREGNCKLLFIWGGAYRG